MRQNMFDSIKELILYSYQSHIPSVQTVQKNDTTIATMLISKIFQYLIQGFHKDDVYQKSHGNFHS